MVVNLFSVLLTFSLSFASVTARSLQDASQREIDKGSLSSTLIVVFQKDCSACLRQVKDLKCLQDTEVILLGAFSKEKDLRDEYRKFSVKYPAYYGDDEVLSYLSIEAVLTPQLHLILGGQEMTILGYTPCQKILSNLKLSRES